MKLFFKVLKSSIFNYEEKHFWLDRNQLVLMVLLESRLRCCKRPEHNTAPPVTVLSLGFKVLNLGFQVLGLGFEVLNLGFQVWGVGFKVLGLGFKVLNLGFQVLGLGFEVLNLGFQVLGLGFKVLGLGFKFLNLGFQVLRCQGAAPRCTPWFQSFFVVASRIFEICVEPWEIFI